MRLTAYSNELTYWKNKKTGDIYKLHVEQDSDECFDPRRDDNVGTMIIYWSRYDLGDDKQGLSQDEWRERYEKYRNDENYVVLPLYVYEHSGITISTGNFGDPWDSGLAGFIFVSKERAFKEYGNINEDNWKEKATEHLKGEVEIYRMYLEDEVYGYFLYKSTHNTERCPHCNEILREYDTWKKEDCCSGFFGADMVESGLIDNAGLNEDEYELLGNYEDRLIYGRCKI